MKKLAARVSDRRDSVEGTAADSLGRIGGLPAAVVLDPLNVKKFIGGLTPQEAEKIVARFKKKYPKELEDVEVQLGGTDLKNLIVRSATTPRTSIAEKLIQVPLAPALLGQTLASNLTRADHYNPLSNTVVSFSGNPHVLEHELGHAVDFNRKSKPARTAYTLGPGLVSSTLPRPLSKPALSVYSLWPEAKATSEALALAESPEALEASRNVLFPAYGTYAGGAAGGLGAMYQYLTTGKVKKRLGILPLVGAAGGHIAARVYNRLSKKTDKRQTQRGQKEKRASSAASATLLAFVDELSKL